MTRRTGKTTAEMKAAPIGAVYIVQSQKEVEYTRHLAHHLGRDDLHIVTPVWLSGYGWRGSTFSAVKVDHSCELNPEEHIYLQYAKARAHGT